MGTSEGEVWEDELWRGHWDGDCVAAEAGGEAAIAIGIVEGRAGVGGAVGGLDEVQRAVGGRTEVGGGE